MNQENRLILAMVLSALILFGYYSFFGPKRPVMPVPVATAPQTEIPTSQPTQTPTPTVIPPAASAPVDAQETHAEIKDIRIETAKTDVTLSTKGGVLTRYALKNYHVAADAQSPLRDLLAETPDSYALFVGVKGFDKITPDTVFEVVRDAANPDGSHVVVLGWQDSTLRFEKQFLFGGPQSDYAVLLSYTVTNRSKAPLTLTPYLNERIHQKPVHPRSGFMAILRKPEDIFGLSYFQDNKLTQNMNWAKFTQPITATSQVQWAGVSDRYFLLSLLPDQGQFATATLDLSRDNDFILGSVTNAAMTVAPGAKADGHFSAYFGPKRHDDLQKVGANLDKAVDYGWFSVLAVPILWLMTTLHRFIPNWGLVIIALTFVLKIILHPVNKKSFTSMKAMQQLQPKLQEIKKKYPDDRDRQNVEVMQLFRTHKVNPAAGCLPMLLQMPVYIVLYKVLWNAIELYHAPFVGPYKDLAAPDPYYVLPILLGVFMVLQQKLTPNASADPAQQKMMMVMPLMFMTFMVFLPVGLVVYIFVNTLMSVIQQFMLKRDLTVKDFLTGKWQPKNA